MKLKLDLNNLAREVHIAYKLKGFHDKEYSNEHLLCLVINKFMGTVVAYRENERANINGKMFYDWKDWFEDNIKDTVEDKLCDTVIGLLDLAELRNLDLESILSKKWDKVETFEDIYIKGLKEEHENKSISEYIFYVNTLICRDAHNHISDAILYGIFGVYTLCQYLNIDLWKYIKLRLNYIQVC